MKPCPFCAEAIQDAAIKCRFCGEFLDGRASGTGRPPGEDSPAGPPWYFSGGSLFVSFLVAGPLMLPLVWLHPTWDRGRKASTTVVILAATAVLGRLAWDGYRRLTEVYSMLGAF